MGIIVLLQLVLSFAAFALGVFTFIDALTRPTAAFVAAGKLTKPIWLAITGVSALVLFPFFRPFGLFSFFGIPALVAVLVYFLDVRPAVRGMSGGRPPNTSSW
ncbi:MAG: DUF2516 family protein [Actinomycetes bacterium]